MGTGKIYDLQIPNNAQLVAMGIKTFSWDPAYKGNDIDVLFLVCLSQLG